MAVTRAKKIEQVEKLSGDLKNVSSAIVATYSKLTVAQDFELRKLLRSSGAKYRVVKNTLAERAAQGHEDRRRAEESSRRDVDRIHRRRSGRDGQGACEIRERQSGVHLQGGSGRRPRDHGQRDRSAGHHAVEGRNLREASVHAERSRRSAWLRRSARLDATWRWSSTRACRRRSSKRRRLRICNWEIRDWQFENRKACGLSITNYKSVIANSSSFRSSKSARKKIWLSRSGGCAAETWRCLAPRDRPGRTGNPAAR